MKMESLIKRIEDLENIDKLSKQNIQTLKVMKWSLVLVQRHQLEAELPVILDNIEKLLSDLEFHINQKLYIDASQGK